jgi:hypothetical protein
MYYELNEKVLMEAKTATATDEGLRERVRSLVMHALVERKADPGAVKDVIRSAIAGIDGGLAQRGVEAGDAVREAVKGMDEAVARSVYAIRMALEEAWEQGREFADTDAKEAVSSIQDLEEDLLSTLRNAADDAGGWIRSELRDLAVHLKRTGTDTGMQARDVTRRLNNRLSSAARGSGADAKRAVNTTRARLSEVASGILRGVADAIDGRAGQSDVNNAKTKE